VAHLDVFVLRVQFVVGGAAPPSPVFEGGVWMMVGAPLVSVIKPGRSADHGNDNAFATILSGLPLGVAGCGTRHISFKTFRVPRDHNGH
jgi:hypothetical protein